MNKIAKFTLLISLIVVLITFFRLFIMSLIPFFGVFVILLGIIILIVVVFVDIVYFFKNFKRDFYNSIFPLGICLIAIILILSMLIYDWERKLNFIINYNSRQEVVEQIINGTIKNKSLIKLPKKYQYLSRSGIVRLKHSGNLLWVEFDIYHTFPGRGEGVIYSSNEKIPPIQLLFYRNDGVYFTKKSSKWYWYDYR